MQIFSSVEDYTYFALFSKIYLTTVLGSSDENSKQNLYLYPGDDVKIKAIEF